MAEADAVRAGDLEHVEEADLRARALPRRRSTFSSATHWRRSEVPTAAAQSRADAFANVDVSTVDRSVKRAFGGATSRTPFDLATHQVCGTPDATRETLEAVFSAVAQSFRETDAMEKTLRVFLRANFVEACREEGLLAASIVTSAACAHLNHGDHEADSEQSKIARELVEMRQLQTKELVEAIRSWTLDRYASTQKAAKTFCHDGKDRPRHHGVD